MIQCDSVHLLCASRRDSFLPAVVFVGLNELHVRRADMDERGDSMTDTGPLVKLKDAMKKIKKDITAMDLRIGTVAHNLLHIKLAEQSSKENKRGADNSDDED